MARCQCGRRQSRAAASSSRRPILISMPATRTTSKCPPTSLPTNHITGKTAHAWNDFTPIAMLCDEFIGSRSKRIRRSKTGRTSQNYCAKIAALPVGIATSAGNTNHIALALLAKRVGGDVKSSKSSCSIPAPKSTTALLGGHVGLVTTPAATALPHMQSGALRIIAVAAPKRLGGALAQVPTWRELGYDIVVSNWRPVAGAARVLAQNRLRIGKTCSNALRRLPNGRMNSR